jgi:hypothetical protein
MATHHRASIAFWLRTGLQLLGCGTLLLALTSCEPSKNYSGASIVAYVVDADSREPVADVHVAAIWEVDGGFSHEIVGYAKVMETVSDAQGKFSFPGWGPVSVSGGVLRGASPALLLFKPGYVYSAFGNTLPADTSAPLLTTSQWHEKRLPLAREHGHSVAEIDTRLAMLRIQLDHLYLLHHIPEIPQFVCAVAERDNQLRAQGASGSGDMSAVHAERLNCASATRLK